MVGQVLDERRIPSLAGDLAVAHCRYSTTGSTVWENAQPTLRLGPRRALAIGHNGNLVNTRELLDQLEGGRGRLPASTDTELLTALLADEPAEDTVDALPARPAARARRVQPRDPRRARVIGVRDPHGFRPLVLGRLPLTDDGVDRPGLWGDDTAGWILASETAALDIVGAEYVRDVEPGEIVVLEPGREPVSVRYAVATPALCVFELIYFARPDSYMEGRNLYEARRHMGMQLAIEHPVDGRPRDARARHGRAGRGRVRGGVRDPVPRGHGPQPVQRPDVHPAQPGDAPAGRQRQAQPAARGRPRPAARSSSTTRSCAAPRPSRSSACCDAPARARSTSGSARRRSTTPASTASTPRSRPSSSPSTHSVEEIREFVGRRLARLPVHRRRPRRARPAVRPLLLRLLRRQLPGARPVRRRPRASSCSRPSRPGAAPRMTRADRARVPTRGPASTSRPASGRST